MVTDPRWPTTIPSRAPCRPPFDEDIIFKPLQLAEPQFDTDAPFEFRIQSVGSDLCPDSAKLRVVRKLIVWLGGMYAHMLCVYMCGFTRAVVTCS